MDGLELYRTLDDRLKDLKAANESMRASGLAFAQAERDYKVAKARKILQLRADGFPVTITQDVAMGCDEVADLRFARDCAEVTYDTDRELVYSLKLSLRLIENEINRQTAGR